MGTLLDLIFENLFFVIIVVVGIFNFISRMTKGEVKQEQPKNKPLLDDLEDVLKDFVPFAGEEERRQQEQQQPTFVEKQIQDEPYVNEFEKKRQELEALEKQEKAAFERLQTLQQTTQLSKPAKRKELVFNVNKINNEGIVQGVIWSEVLGKPRAFKSHSRFTHRSR